ILAVAAWVLLGSSPPAAAQTAVHTQTQGLALVVGVSAYEKAHALVNPVNDATAVGTAVRELGFDTIGATGPRAPDLQLKLTESNAKLRDAEVVLLYFAGHGIQINGRNFLVAKDLDPNNRDTVLSRLIPLETILGEIEKRARPSAAKIVILDACRDNPFAAPLVASGQNVGRGLAPVDLAAPADATQCGGAGYFRVLAYSTAPNDVASDGSGVHSPYTQSLIKHIRQPGIEVRDMFVRIAADVMETTKGAQRPEYLAQTSRLL